MTYLKKWLLFAGTLACASSSHAVIFFFPLPNLARPPQLQALIDALEKSTEVRALAFTSEDKLFGGKTWVWGHHTGSGTQEEANQRAIRACNASLAQASSQYVGGRPLYNFGAKICELYTFTPNGAGSANAAPSEPPASNSNVILQSTPIPMDLTKPAHETPTSSIRVSVPGMVPSSDSERAAESRKSEKTVGKRLEELNELLKAGLVTEDEYRIKRKEILDSL